MIGVQFSAGQAVKRAEVQTTGEDTVGSAALSGPICKKVNLALLLDDSLGLMKRTDAGLAGGWWRARAGAR